MTTPVQHPRIAIIGLGFWAGRTRFFTAEATAYLTKFVFYFALSAMIFRFAATLDLIAIFNWTFVTAYLAASGAGKKAGAKKSAAPAKKKKSKKASKSKKKAKKKKAKAAGKKSKKKKSKSKSKKK